MRYIDADLFVENKRELYCKDCDRRKNSKGKLVYEIGGAPCRACGVDDMLDDVEDFPTADVAEVRHGKWIKTRYRTFICSCCKRSVYLDGLNVTDKNETKLLRELYPYCHCGARMDGEEK